MKPKKLLPLLLPGLLLVVVLSGLYVASPGFTGGRFRDEAASHVGVYLEKNQILVSDPEAVQVEGTTATIVKGGEYKLSGSLYDGQIIVDAPAEEQVVLKLDNVDIHCEHSAPLWAKNADRVKLKLPEDSINRFSDGVMYNDPDPEVKSPSACIYSQCDLTVKGKGQLTVEANFQDGIQSTDSLYLKNGVVMVTAPHYALRGKDDVTMIGGIWQLSSDYTAVSSAGFVDIQGGEMEIDTNGSAFHAVTAVTVGENSRVRARCGLLPVQCGGRIELAYPIAEGEGE